MASRGPLDRDCKEGALRGDRRRATDDGPEGAPLAVGDAQTRAAALARERDALAQKLRSTEAALAEERTRGARREAAVAELRRGFEAAMAWLSAGSAAEATAREELRTILEELQATALELAERNAVLAALNQRLEGEVAMRAAELEAALAALREEEDRLRLIVEGARDIAILTFDTEGRVSTWNPGAERLLGFTADEVLGRRLDAIWVPEDLAADAPAAEMSRTLEQGRAEDERWHLCKNGTRFWASAVMAPLPATIDGRPRGFVKVIRDRTEARRERERREVLLRELDHRVKNALAVVQSVALQSGRHAPTPADFQDGLVARLRALALSHDLLRESAWEGASLNVIAERTLAAYAGPVGAAARVRVQGPAIRLAPTAAVTMNLALHELAANAAKHGALSIPEGRVELRWTLDRTDPERPRIDIVWRERGGPPVSPPSRRGFGSRLIERGLRREFGAEVRLDFVREGVECRISLPAGSRIVAAS